MIVDVSMYQHALELDDLPDHVSGVIIKATQGTFHDPAFDYFLAQTRAQPRWKWVGFYHFLSDRGPQTEAQFFLDTIRAIGGLQPREFVVLDWENNAITGYQPPMSDARAWMTIVDHSLPGRTAWYSYRSNAVKARQSGDFPWPLWLADPNPNGLDYAHQLDAFLLQSGQETLADINIDVNDIIDIATLDELTNDGDTMPTPQEIWDHPLTQTYADGSTKTLPAWQWLLYTYTESTVDGGPGSGGGATAAEVADELARRLTS